MNSRLFGLTRAVRPLGVLVCSLARRDGRLPGPSSVKMTG